MEHRTKGDTIFLEIYYPALTTVLLLFLSKNHGTYTYRVSRLFHDIWLTT
jgi:hypothetical protein